MQRSDCVEIGYISKAHGLRGEVRAVLDVYDLSEYLEIAHLYLAKGDNPLRAYNVQRLHLHQPAKGEVILRLAEVSDRNAAEELKGSTLYFPEAELPALEEGHFYFFEVIGFQVVDAARGPLGTIKYFADGTAQDLMVMEYEGHEVMIPVTEQIVGQADHDAQTIAVNLPEGLLELYLGQEGPDDEDP